MMFFVPPLLMWTPVWFGAAATAAAVVPIKQPVTRVPLTTAVAEPM